jgi:hypothetical protein
VVVARDFPHQAPPFGKPFRDSATIPPPRQPPRFCPFFLCLFYKHILGQSAAVFLAPPTSDRQSSILNSTF